MTSTAPILRHDQDAIAVITLNRPEAYNALSLKLMNALLDELGAIAESDGVRAVVIKGAGRGFCAGHDLREMTRDDDRTLQAETFQTCSRLMQLLPQLPQPVIAQVHGIATAAGCQLVASCDLAVATEEARFATPGVNIGLFCSTPMVALTRTVAPKHAMEMLLLGEMIDAQRAYEIGLINRVVTTDSLERQVMEMAATLAAKSALTLGIGKQAFYRQLNQPLTEAYDHCSSVMACNLDSEDAREGIDAFLKKRPAVWKDR